MPNGTQSTIRRQKTCQEDIEISYTISFTAAGISMLHICICSLQCAIARSRACCAAAAQNLNRLPKHRQRIRNRYPPVPSQTPNRGQKRCTTPAFSDTPNKLEQNQMRLSRICFFKGPKEGQDATSSPRSLTSVLKKPISDLPPNGAFSGAPKRGEMVRHHRILRDPQQTRKKSGIGASLIPAGEPETGQQCYTTPSFQGVLKGQEKKEVGPSALPTQKCKTGRKCYVSPVLSGIRNKIEKNQKLLGHQCLLGRFKGT